MKFLLGIFLTAAFFPLTSVAQGFRGTIDFSAEEKAAHQQHIDTITRVARRFLEDIWREHQAFYRRHRVSKFYGDRNVSLNTRSKRIAALRQAGAPLSGGPVATHELCWADAERAQRGVSCAGECEAGGSVAEDSPVCARERSR